MTDLEARIQNLYEYGYCVVESVHDSDAVRHQERLLHEEWRRRGSPELTGFGIGVHPLHQHVPDIARYFDCPAVNDVLEGAFHAPPRLCHTGARIADEHSALNIGWHHHYGWDDSRLKGRTRIERVVVNYYVKGVSPAIGSLWAVPRAVSEPMGSENAGRHEDWPGQKEIAVPPGSAVILDTALFHTATRGTMPGMRYHWGGHYQAWTNEMPHSEDMDLSDLSGQSVLMDQYPGLKRLLIR